MMWSSLQLSLAARSKTIYQNLQTPPDTCSLGAFLGGFFKYPLVEVRVRTRSSLVLFGKLLTVDSLHYTRSNERGTLE
jgi:uncharacterized membrane protein YwaF